MLRADDGADPAFRHVWAPLERRIDCSYLPIMRRLNLLARFLQFRDELVALWRAFLDPATPLHLKALMLLVPLYLLSPVDLIPDFIPLAGWLDDIVIIPMLVSWIFGLLARPQERAAPRRPRKPGSTIDGTWRRL